MPNRILRNYTSSEKVNKITAHAETLFVRLMQVADDFGSYHSDARLVKSACYPLRVDELKSDDVAKWLKELRDNELIVIYTVDHRHYLRIIDFRQRLQNMRNRFPGPPDDVKLTAKPNSPGITVNHGESRTEEETKPNQKRNEGETKPSPAPVDDINTKLFKFLNKNRALYYPQQLKTANEEIVKFQNKHNITDKTTDKELLKKWDEFDERIFNQFIAKNINKDIDDMRTHYSSRNNKIEGEPIVNWTSVMKGWMRRKAEGFTKKK